MKTKVVSSSNLEELSDGKLLRDILFSGAIPEEFLLDNIGLFLRRQTLSRILLMNKLYEKIISKHGIIMEFGVFFGQNQALFSSLRGIHEPYNYTRKIVGFDTFNGFPSISEKDGKNDAVSLGSYSVTKNYEEILQSIIKIHSRNSPLHHCHKFELIKGDASQTLKKYLSSNPETIVSLAYFDFDIYEPTRDCLSILLPHLAKGSIIVFDELNCPQFPGETIAFKEILGINNYVLNRDKDNPYVSWIEF